MLAVLLRGQIALRGVALAAEIGRAVERAVIADQPPLAVGDGRDYLRHRRDRLGRGRDVSRPAAIPRVQIGPSRQPGANFAAKARREAALVGDVDAHPHRGNLARPVAAQRVEKFGLEPGHGIVGENRGAAERIARPLGPARPIALAAQRGDDRIGLRGRQGACQIFERRLRSYAVGRVGEDTAVIGADPGTADRQVPVFAREARFIDHPALAVVCHRKQQRPADRSGEDEQAGRIQRFRRASIEHLRGGLDPPHRPALLLHVLQVRQVAGEILVEPGVVGGVAIEDRHGPEHFLALAAQLGNLPVARCLGADQLLDQLARQRRSARAEAARTDARGDDADQPEPVDPVRVEQRVAEVPVFQPLEAGEVGARRGLDEQGLVVGVDQDCAARQVGVLDRLLAAIVAAVAVEPRGEGTDKAIAPVVQRGAEFARVGLDDLGHHRRAERADQRRDDMDGGDQESGAEQRGQQRRVGQQRTAPRRAQAPLDQRAERKPAPPQCARG